MSVSMTLLANDASGKAFWSTVAAYVCRNTVDRSSPYAVLTHGSSGHIFSGASSPPSGNAPGQRTGQMQAAPSFQRPGPHSSNSWVELSSALSQHAIAAPIDGFISLLSMAERSGAPKAECPLLAAASSQNHWCIVSKLQ
ncbi:unnamed protein product [Symbiodinium microadriaticum]|nr:unnamed protein product [Symbiodinium microadriaticum]